MGLRFPSKPDKESAFVVACSLGGWKEKKKKVKESPHAIYNLNIIIIVSDLISPSQKTFYQLFPPPTFPGYINIHYITFS